MIDIVFLLIVFFMLVAELTRARGLELDLARLDGSDAARLGTDRRLVVHVVPSARERELAGSFRFDARTYAGDAPGLAALASAIRGQALELPENERAVYVRAARDERYARVHPALRAATDAGVTRVELVVDGRAAGALP